MLSALCRLKTGTEAGRSSEVAEVTCSAAGQEVEMSGAAAGAGARSVAAAGAESDAEISVEAAAKMTQAGTSATQSV